MKQITLSRRFWRPTATEKNDNVCSDATIEGIVVGSPRDLEGRFGTERVVDVQTGPQETVTVRLRGYLGILWDATPAAKRAPGATVRFEYTGRGKPTPQSPEGRPQFAFYVDE